MWPKSLCTKMKLTHFRKPLKGRTFVKLNKNMAGQVGKRRRREFGALRTPARSLRLMPPRKILGKQKKFRPKEGYHIVS